MDTQNIHNLQEVYLKVYDLVESDYMRAQGRSFGINPEDTEKSIDTVMQRRKKAAGM